MKIALCQHNPIPGDVRGNCEQLRELIDVANQQEADLILCPESATTGYLVRDLMYRKGMIEKNLRYANELAAYTAFLRPNTTLVFGYQGWNTSGQGKPFRNMAAICRNGAMIGSYAKRLLPFYDVFDEGRYYEPGEEGFVFECGGRKWGVLICEDGWSADKGETAAYYSCNPVWEYVAQDVDNFVWINASPFVRGKLEKRLRIAGQMSHKGIVAYCNQFGGQDSLVFDGHSFVLDQGSVVDWNGDQDRPSVWVVQTGSRSVPPTEDLKKMLVLGTRDYAHKCGFSQAAVLSSGGVDSAVVLSIACEALGAENVTGIRAPTTISSADAEGDAVALHQAWGCKDQLVTINHESMLEHLNKSFGFDPQSESYNSVAYENAQPRLRALSAMHFCNVTGALLLSTGNKTEMATGYFTYGGDPTGGFDPLVDCYKGEVYEVGRQFPQIPKHILEKRPTADLRPGQFDQESLLPYPILDRIVEAYIEDYVTTYDDFLEWAKTAAPSSVLQGGLAVFQLDAESYARMVGKIDRAEWKRQQVGPGVKVHRVSFGIGRRNPIAARG